MMSVAVQLVPQSPVVSVPNVAHTQPQRQIHDLEDQFEPTKPRTARHCNQEFLTRVGIVPRMPVDPAVGPVGTSGSTAGGALIGLGLGLLIWVPLGVSALAVKKSNSYHSVVRGVLFLALGIPGFTAIGAAIGACAGSGGKDI